MSWYAVSITIYCVQQEGSEGEGDDGKDEDYQNVGVHSRNGRLSRL